MTISFQATRAILLASANDLILAHGWDFPGKSALICRLVTNPGR